MFSIETWGGGEGDKNTLGKMERQAPSCRLHTTEGGGVILMIDDR